MGSAYHSFVEWTPCSTGLLVNMASGYGLTGGVSRCFPFWQEYMSCYVINQNDLEARKRGVCAPRLECPTESRSSKSARKRTKGRPNSEPWFDWERRRVKSPATNERCLKEGASTPSGNFLLVGAVVPEELYSLYILEEKGHSNGPSGLYHK